MSSTTNEKQFESDIEASFLSWSGGYVKGTDTYDPKLGLYVNTLINFIKDTQPKAWARFENTNKIDTDKKFCQAFNNACDMNGLIYVLRHGFKHRGITFRVCYFKPESTLNQTAAEQYSKNHVAVYRQWFYSAVNHNSVDMVLVLNGIPVIALELKNQYTGQTVDNAKIQWMYDRDPREICFQFNKRILAFFAVDHTDVWLTTKLEKEKTRFLPFNMGSNGPGVDGGAGNPPNPSGYPTAYLWEEVLQKDSLMDILQKFIHLQVSSDKKIQKDGTEKTYKHEALIFPRFHQLDVVRKLIADVSQNGAGTNYLIQHSAGSGKSNSIAWTAYRLASLHDSENNAIFSSVVVVTDRTVLDAQLQETISSFDHTLGAVETIGENKTSKDLRDALNAGARIIVTTLQKFPVIYQEVDEAKGRNYAVIVDEAHSSQTGSAATKLKTALADLEEALKEYAEIEGVEEEEVDKYDPIVREMIAHGRHKNLSFFAFTATPKGTTLEMFGTEYEDGSYHPFHIYSMKQAIEEGFILDVLQNYMTYDTCYKIAKTIEDNPEVPSSRAAKAIRKFQELHPYNISQKAQIIVETFMETTRNKIGGKGKMMVVTSSRLASVRYVQEIRRYIEEKHYDNVGVLVAFSGTVKDGEEEYTEPKLNTRRDGSHIGENQTKAEFHDNYNVLVVAEKYQTGFDEPLLHTMIVDKKLRGVKAVQTLSRLNRTYPGKTDTFVLDFMNSKEDIEKAFQPFYQETMLSSEVNTDLLYEVEKKIRDYKIYSDLDIENFAEAYALKDSNTANVMGKMTSALKPCSDSYNSLAPEDKYDFRRLARSFVKWYGYVSQVVRMFDADLHKEYLFLSYLLGLIPEQKDRMIDLEGKLQLEYYKLQKTFEGSIQLADEPGLYVPATASSITKPEEKKPLEEIIDKINEYYKGQFTDADKVIIDDMVNRLKKDEKLRKMAQTADPMVFNESIFPKTFNIVAQDSYMESQDSYTNLFTDQAKYNAVMRAVGDLFYRDARALPAPAKDSESRKKVTF